MKVNSIICMISVVTMSGLTCAADLKIANHTQYNLSFEINNDCSDKFGVVPKHTNKIISEKAFNKACEYNSKRCSVVVYNDSNCKGKYVGGIGFDTRYGVIYVSGRTSSPINITARDFNIIFDYQQ